MLVISKAQMDTLGQIGVENFVEKMMQLFREEFPDEMAEIDVEEVRQEISELVEEGQELGFVTESEVFTYLWAVKFLGRDLLDEYPEAAEVLLSEDVAGDVKAVWLQKWTISKLES